jgi:hypothetical protein
MSLVVPEAHQQFQVSILAFFFQRILADHKVAYLASA